MKFKQTSISIKTRGRESRNITDSVKDFVMQCDIGTGLCQVFLQHTSASLMFCENADPTVQQDLERFMSRLVPDGDPIYQHTAEGPDDMPAHVRSVMTQNSLSIPIHEGQLALGIWQGIFLWEHRTSPHNRKIVLTVFGE